MPSQTKAKVVSAQEKHRVMLKAMATAKGRSAIAANIQEPLRLLRDYQSVGRRAFMVDELPDGTIPAYDQDPDVPCYVVGEEADSVQTIVRAKRLQVPMFELAANPTVPFTQVKERRFDVVKRIKQKSKHEIFRKEDKLIFASMNVAADGNTAANKNPTIVVSRAQFNMATLATAFACIESRGLFVDKVFMNPNEFPVLRNAGRDYLDFETQRELLQTGLRGVLWGAQIILSMEVLKGDIFLTAEPEYFGILPVRTELTVIPADEPANRKFGWSVFQQIGVGIHNSYNGLQKVKVTG